MTKTKTIYTCQNCGAQSPKWLGKCNSCDEWNTFVEEVVHKKLSTGTLSAQISGNKPLTLDSIETIKNKRISVGIEEFNRVLGGGIVPGSLILLGGDPGIGKSTLALQLALGLKDKKILYTSGEESLQQIKLRAERLNIKNENCLFLSETSLEQLIAQSEYSKPDLLVIDSIQTVSTETIESSPGSVSQVRECTSAIMKFAKKQEIAVLLIGHINKEGWPGQKFWNTWWIPFFSLKATRITCTGFYVPTKTVLARPTNSGFLRCAVMVCAKLPTRRSNLFQRSATMLAELPLQQPSRAFVHFLLKFRLWLARRLMALRNARLPVSICAG